MNKNNSGKIFNKPSDLKNFSKTYFLYFNKLLKGLDHKSLEKFVQVLLGARKRDSNIFLIGNGGSAATASHFAQDLAFFIKDDGFRPFKAQSLTDSVPLISALGNDYGYENIFVDQLRVLLRRKDILIAISGSGNSPNLIKAINYANEKGGITFGLIGFDGGEMKKICKHCILIKTPKGEYELVESIHLLLTQFIRNYLRLKFK